VPCGISVNTTHLAFQRRDAFLMRANFRADVSHNHLDDAPFMRCQQSRHMSYDDCTPHLFDPEMLIA